MATGGWINTDMLSDETFDVLCTICKNSEGVKFCVDCQDYFCINCVQVHSKVPVCASHNMLDKSLVTSGIIKGQPRAPEERCGKHSHKHIDMYCQNHDNVGCSTCMAVDHRSCPDTVYIPEFIQNNTYQSASTEIQTKLKEISKTLADQITTFKQDKQRLLKRKAELLADIRKFRQRINDQLDNLEKNSIDEVAYKVKHLQDKIEDNLQKLQDTKARVASANDKLASPNTNQAEVFVHVKIGEDVANVADECIEDNKSKRTGYDIEFQPDKTILTLLEQYKAIGTVTELAPKTPCTLFQIIGKQSYCVTAKPDEEDSNFRSVCSLNDGTIILADYNKNKLSRFHGNNYTVTDYPLPGAPWQVCSINSTQAAVTLPSQQEVHFISVEGQMKTTKKINTDYECYGLAYKNKNLYISDYYLEVYIYSLSGRKRKQLRIKQPLPLFSYSRNILAVSKDATKFYFAGSQLGPIYPVNLNRGIPRFNDGKLNRATYCYVTEVGSVLVSGYHSNNVLQFTSDGKLLGEVIQADSGTGEIVSVCCNKQMSKIYVSRFGKNYIEVYDIGLT